MNYLSTDDVIRIHARLIQATGGLPGIKNYGMIDSAVAQPRMTFSGEELYLTLPEKAAAFGFSLARNHGFEDGNKRIAHAAMETFLVANGHELQANVDEQEQIILQLAASTLSRDEFTVWVASNVVPLD